MDTLNFVNEYLLMQRICTTLALPELHKLLDIRELCGFTTKLNHNIIPLLQEESKNDSNAEYCKVLKQLVSLCQNSQFSNLLSHVISTINSTDRDITAKTNLCSLLFDLTSEQSDIQLLNSTVAEHNTIEIILATFLKASPKLHLAKQFFSKLQTLNQQTFCHHIWRVIKETDNLEILCYFYDTLDHYGEHHFYKSAEYWQFLQNNLRTSHFSKQKLVLYLINKTVSSLLEQDMLASENDYLTCTVKNVNELKLAFNNYCLLIDISYEKQLHLVHPSLNKLETIDILHPSWLVILYDKLLNHMQTQVIKDTLKIIITQNWYFTKQYFRIVTNLILSAINQFKQKKDVDQICNLLSRVLPKLSADYLNMFIEAVTNINFNPCVYYCITNLLFTYDYDCSDFLNVSGSDSIKICDQIIKLPHKIIRKRCAQYLEYYAIKKDYTASDMLKIKTLFANVGIEMEPYIERQTNEEKNLLLQQALDNDKVDTHLLKYITNNLNVNLPDVFVQKANEYKLSKQSRDILSIYSINSPISIDYLIERINTLTVDEDVTILLKSLYDIFDIDFVMNDKLSDRCFKIVYNKDSNSNQVWLAFLLLNLDFSSRYKLHLSTEFVEAFITSNNDSPDVVKKMFCLFYFSSLGERYETLKSTISSVIEFLLASESISVILYLMENLKILSKMHNENIDNYFKQIYNFIISVDTNPQTRWQLFETYGRAKIISNNDIESFSTVWLEVFGALKGQYVLQYNILDIITTTMKLSTEHKLVHKAVSILVDLLIAQTFCTKADRFEYEVVYNTDVWCLYKMGHISILRLIADNTDVFKTTNFDILMTTLLEKYKETHKSRYFPDSETHIQKIRILQALLYICEHISKSSKIELVNFAVASLESENHQTSVRQLLQLLLLRLRGSSKEQTTKILESLASAKNVSFLTAVMSILHYLLEDSSWDIYEKAIRIVTEHLFGALFALRLHAQKCYVTIIRSAPERLNAHLEKYYTLCELIENMLDVNEDQLYATLKTTMLFYTAPVSKVHVDSIQYSLLSLNEVYISECNKYSCMQSSYWDKFSKHHEFLMKKLKKVSKRETAELSSFSAEVQKKIVPWKNIDDTATSNTEENDLIVICSLIKSAANIGGISRTCEVFGVKKLMVEKKQIVAENDFKNLSMSSEGWIDIRELKPHEIDEYIATKRKEGYALVGLEQTTKSVAIDQFCFPKKVIVFLGNEKQGLPSNLISLMDFCIEIPQFGNTRSLNVHVAGAILIWEYTKQYRF